METDDDYQLFSPPQQPSPPIHHRKLKRLKKSIDVSSNSDSALEDLPIPVIDSFESQSPESPETLGSENLDEPLRSQSPSLSFHEDRKETRRALDFDELSGDFEGKRSDKSDEIEENASDLNSERLEKKRLSEEDLNETLGSENLDEPLRSQLPSLSFHEDRKETRRALDFDELSGDFEGKRSDKSDEIEENVSDLNSERLEKKRLSEEDLNDNEVKEKKKKKRDKSVGRDDPKPKKSKKREEKERKNYLQQLHVESQRLLRETRDATFKPIPVVQKPISSILEKIRQRKFEVMKKTVNLQSNRSFSENIGSFIEGLVDHDSENVSITEREVDQIAELVQEETIVRHLDVESSLHASHADGSEEAVTQTSDENSPSQMDLDEQSTRAFRAPVDDTQDLFFDSQTSEEKDDTSNDQNNRPLEEVLAPSLLAMNLKFDSAPHDDMQVSSDEEDNNKENIEPESDRDENGHSSPKGDPVKAFVDDEAVEEDDGDNDLLCFQENEEDEGIEDYEELNDLIATEYDEKPIDNERRNELHQKWLEQQDRAGTDNLLQRLKYGSKLKDTTLLEEEGEEDDEDAEEFDDEVAEDPVKANGARINSRKAKQMIPQMFSEKNDGYLSSDEEEVEKRLVKQRLLEKAEDQDALLSPVEDESSRQVFGLIKKLNIAPDAKKKTKTSSFFDNILTGRNNDSSSSKSSFLGRASSHSLPSSHKQGSGTVRSFIFGRDDSNSRSSISVSEDSADAIPQENRPTRSTVYKFSSSQSRSSTQTQSTKNTAETVNGASLYDLLKRSSMQSNVCHQDNMVGLTQTVFAAFKIPKKPIKIEGRT